MAEIYGDLESPRLSLDAPNILDIVHDLLDGDSLPGLRSALYGYQRCTVAAMIRSTIYRMGRSSFSSPPLWRYSVSGLCSHRAAVEFYAKNWAWFLHTPKSYFSITFSVGTGKTVMILSLILETLDELPEPEESLLDSRPVLTPIALSTFTTPVFGEARRRVAHDVKAKAAALAVGASVPSLVQELLHVAKTNPGKTGQHYHEDALEGTHLLVLTVTRDSEIPSPRKLTSDYNVRHFIRCVPRIVD